MKAYSFYFNASDWLASPAVRGMSKAERGVYICLLALAWERDGRLPAGLDKFRRLAEMSPAEWEESGEILLEQFPLSECGTYRFNARLMVEVEKERIKSERAAASANKRWQSERNATASNKDATASETACVGNAQEQEQVKEHTLPESAAPPSGESASGLPKTEPCPLTAQRGGKPLKTPPADPGPAFDEFWQAYAKKEDRVKCENKWRGMKPAERTAALQAVAAYVLATPNRKYRKNPLTWLNGQNWKDEDTPAADQPAAAPQPVASPGPAPVPEPNLAFLAKVEAAQLAQQQAHFARFTKPVQPCSQPVSQSPH